MTGPDLYLKLVAGDGSSEIIRHRYDQQVARAEPDGIELTAASNLTCGDIIIVNGERLEVAP